MATIRYGGLRSQAERTDTKTASTMSVQNQQFKTQQARHKDPGKLTTPTGTELCQYNWHSAGSLGWHSAGSLGWHSAGSSGWHSAGSSGWHSAGSSGWHSAGSLGWPCPTLKYTRNYQNADCSLKKINLLCRLL